MLVRHSLETATQHKHPFTWKSDMYHAQGAQMQCGLKMRYRGRRGVVVFFLFFVFFCCFSLPFFVICFLFVFDCFCFFVCFDLFFFLFFFLFFVFVFLLFCCCCFVVFIWQKQMLWSLKRTDTPRRKKFSIVSAP